MWNKPTKKLSRLWPQSSRNLWRKQNLLQFKLLILVTNAVLMYKCTDRCGQSHQNWWKCNAKWKLSLSIKCWWDLADTSDRDSKKNPTLKVFLSGNTHHDRLRFCSQRIDQESTKSLHSIGKHTHAHTHTHTKPNKQTNKQNMHNHSQNKCPSMNIYLYQSYSLCSLSKEWWGRPYYDRSGIETGD